MNRTPVKLAMGVIDLLEVTPAQLDPDMREMIVLELYRRHSISAGRTAEPLGMERFAFIRWTGELGIPYFDLAADELREELRVLGSR